MTDRHGKFSPLEREELRNEQLEHDLRRLRAQLAEKERWIGGAHNDMARMT